MVGCLLKQLSWRHFIGWKDASWKARGQTRVPEEMFLAKPAGGQTRSTRGCRQGLEPHPWDGADSQQNVSPCNLLTGERSWSAWNRWRDRRPDFCRCKWQVYGAVSARSVQIFLFFHFELTGKFKDHAPAPFAPQAWPTSWRTIWRCSQILRSATLSRLSKASSSTSHFVYSIIPLWPGWPREVIDSESLNKILSSLDGQWQKWILCLSC